MLDVTKVLL